MNEFPVDLVHFLNAFQVLSLLPLQTHLKTIVISLLMRVTLPLSLAFEPAYLCRVELACTVCSKSGEFLLSRDSIVLQLVAVKMRHSSSLRRYHTIPVILTGVASVVVDALSILVFLLTAG